MSTLNRKEVRRRIHRRIRSKKLHLIKRQLLKLVNLSLSALRKLTLKRLYLTVAAISTTEKSKPSQKPHVKPVLTSKLSIYHG